MCMIFILLHPALALFEGQMYTFESLDYRLKEERK